MEPYQQLFEFVCSLIDIQIKKYSQLSRYGVGPDARMNALLVLEEVNELLESAKQLKDCFEMPWHSSKDFVFAWAFNQVQFYLEQEIIRSRASWLLDDNKFHSGPFERTTAQLQLLKQIAESASFEMPLNATPKSDVQKQCEHDSAATAVYILQLAQDLTHNPEMNLDGLVPEHAIPIMRRNVTTRYTVFAEEINERRAAAESFLNNSQLPKTITTLSSEEATTRAEEHRAQLNQIIAEYRRFIPVTADVRRDAIGVTPQTPRLGFFTEVAITGAIVATYMLINYLRVQFTSDPDLSLKQ